MRKASSASTNEVFAAKVFGVCGDVQHELDFLQILRHVGTIVRVGGSLLTLYKKHVVAYNAFIQDNGSDVLIMELLRGGTLEDKLKREGLKKALPRAKLYWLQLTDALNYFQTSRAENSRDRFGICTFLLACIPEQCTVRLCINLSSRRSLCITLTFSCITLTFFLQRPADIISGTASDSRVIALVPQSL